MQPLWPWMLVGLLLPAQNPLAPPEPLLPLATQTHSLIEQILTHYHRPVSAEKLYVAVCVKMYELAHKPVPVGLNDEVRQACTGEPEQRRLLLATVQSRTLEQVPFVSTEPLLALAEALTAELDPHSGVVPAAEMRRTAQQDSETFGIGVEWESVPAGGAWKVSSVALGSPAQRAGLRPGDWLVRINGLPLAEAPTGLHQALQTQAVDSLSPLWAEEPQQLLPQRPAEWLELQVRRGSGSCRSVRVQPERHRPEVVLGTRRLQGNRWSYWLDEKNQLAHIRLGQLRRGSAEELRHVLSALKRCGLRGLILDLRWCPGGYLNESIEVADLFVNEGVLATVHMRQREDTVYRSTQAALLAEIPLVVLVNAQTSGGAELIAAALQDHARAVVVGQRTRGKASIQTPLALGHEAYRFKVTSGTFVRPSGKNLHRHPESQLRDDWGVRPDVDCRISPQLSHKFYEEWLLWSLRPVEDTQRLALDDPTYDTQRNEALKLLRQRVAGAQRP
jgi:C-terminal peptidase prc